MLNDKLALTGALTITKNGEVVQKIKNLVVTSGKELVAANLQGGSTVPVTHMALGTGTTAAVVADTALETELDRNPLSVSGGTVSGTVVTYTCVWLPGDATGAITEAGLFTAASGGTMLARTVFAVINKGVNDTITVTWEVTIL